jgi:hypothetical protein
LASHVDSLFSTKKSGIIHALHAEINLRRT